MLSGFNIYIYKSEHGISSNPPIVDLSDLQRYHKRINDCPYLKQEIKCPKTLMWPVNVQRKLAWSVLCNQQAPQNSISKSIIVNRTYHN